MSALVQSLLELIQRTAWDLPSDVGKSLDLACRGEAEGTNGRAALETIRRAVECARENETPFGGDPAALRFTVDGPATLDRSEFLSAAAEAAHQAATVGVLRTPMIDLPGGRPRRGKAIGAPPAVTFRDASKTRVHLRLLTYGEVGAVSLDVLPTTDVPGRPTLEGVEKLVLTAIRKQHGRAMGPGVVGVHIGADPVSGIAAAEAELLRPIEEKNAKRPLAQLEARITERANQLGVGPLGLGGKYTILATHVAVDPAPADHWTISTVISAWALRRQTVTLAPDGKIVSWDTALPRRPKKAPKEEAPCEETAAEADDQGAREAKKKAGGATSKKPAAAKKPAATMKTASPASEPQKPAVEKQSATAKKTASAKKTTAAKNPMTAKKPAKK